MIKNVLVTLLLLGALYGCYELFLEHQAAQHASNNPWVSRMTPFIKMHTTKQVASGNESASEASYLTLLFLGWQAAEDGYSTLDTVKRAAAAAGADQSEAARIGAAIHENVQFAKSMGVFTDASNGVKMERGEPPVAHAKGWEDELLVVGWNLSPVLAPEAMFAIPNLRLMPQAVRDMTAEKYNAATTELARKWLTDQIIYPDSYRAIAKKAQETKGR